MNKYKTTKTFMVLLLALIAIPVYAAPSIYDNIVLIPKPTYGPPIFCDPLQELRSQSNSEMISWYEETGVDLPSIIFDPDPEPVSWYPGEEIDLSSIALALDTKACSIKLVMLRR